MGIIGHLNISSAQNIHQGQFATIGVNLGL